MKEQETNTLTGKDFQSDQLVKWCPGCGDHAILKSVEKVFPALGYKKENIVVISGIGCSSRFPYYMNTYGFHGIHGRAAAIATGVKLANPELSVWMITGDGDCLAIGGNHFIHAVRRNIDINILLFNNQIYGLTKGQFSPTTPIGQTTKTSPQGTVEHPFNPGELAIGAQATFYARSIDNNMKHMSALMKEASLHDGTSVVEVMQNCVIFNNGAFGPLADRKVREDHLLFLEHDKPMIFGKESDKGIILKNNELKVVEIGKNGITEDDLLVHNKHTEDSGIHMMLAQMKLPQYPVAVGIIRQIEHSTFEDLVEEQVTKAKNESKVQSLDDLLNSGDTWEM